MMFTDAEIGHIIAIKTEIQSKLTTIVTQPWAESHAYFKKVFLTGGAIASLIQGERPNDWDFYFEDLNTMEDFTTYITNNHMASVKNVNPNYTECLGKDGKMITQKAITMNDGSSFITMIVGEPAEVKKTFDYKHCTAHYSIRDTKLYISPEVYHAAKNKQLIVNNNTVIKPWREDKFLSRGYSKP